MFDKELFANLLIKAQGKRSLNAYAKEAGVASAHISRFKRAMLDTPPNPLIIKKLADKAEGVSYEELMAAAGHIASLDENEKDRAKHAYLMNQISPNYSHLHPDVEKRFEILTEAEMKDLDDMVERNDQFEIYNFIQATQRKSLNDLSILTETENLHNELIKETPVEYFTESPDDQIRNLPIVGNIACGDGIVAYEDIEGYEPTPANWLNGGKYFYLRAKGESMKGLRIQDGDLLLIREQPEVENGEIAAVVIDGYAVLKRVTISGETLVLESANPDFPPRVVSAEDKNIQIIGKLKKVVLDF